MGFYHRASIAVFVPEGRLTIAQRFITGHQPRWFARPEGTIESSHFAFNRPYRTESMVVGQLDPAVNCWAIFKCPSGARGFVPDVPAFVNHYTSAVVLDAPSVVLSPRSSALSAATRL